MSVQVSIALELSGINHKSVPGYSALSEGVGDFFSGEVFLGFVCHHKSESHTRVSEIDRQLCSMGCAGLMTSGLYGYQWGKSQLMHADSIHENIN